MRGVPATLARRFTGQYGMGLGFTNAVQVQSLLRDITQAILSKWNLDFDAYFKLAPDTVDDPYCVYDWLGSSTDDYMGNRENRKQTARIVFKVFSKADDGGLEAGQKAGEIELLYDWVTLSLNDYTPLKMERTGSNLFQVEDDIWQATLLYDVLVIFN